MDDAFQLFKSDMESQDLEYMIFAANKLTIVAAAIGKNRTATEIIPYLPKIMTIPVDEVLAAIGRQLYFIWDIAGGSSLSEESYKIIFACLRQLGEEEEIVVRQSAIKAFSSILPLLSPDAMSTYLIPLFRAFSSSDTFGSRYTAASILSLTQQYSPPSYHDEIKQVLIALSQDETPMVRRVIASILPQYCQVLTMHANATNNYQSHLQRYETITTTIIPIIQQLSLDERDYLRDLAPQAIIGLIPHIPIEQFHSTLLPIIIGLNDDLSWKVRQQLCQQCPLLIATLIKRAIYEYDVESKLIHPTDTKAQNDYKSALQSSSYDINKCIEAILNIFKHSLLADSNLEVRSTAVLLLSDIIYLSKGIIPEDLFDVYPRQPIYTAKATELDSLILDLQFPHEPHLKKPYQRPLPYTTIFTIDHQTFLDDIGIGITDLTRDLSALSKVDLAENLSKIAPFLGSEYLTRYMLPVIGILAQDEHVQVRSTIILSLEPFLSTFSQDIIITQIWPILEALHIDLRWRVRRAVATQITPICYYLKTNTEFIQQNVIPMIEALLSENVHAVRNRTAMEFRSLIYILGNDFIGVHFAQLCRDLFNPKANYLHRITALHFVYFSSTAFEKSCPKTYIFDNYTSFFIEALQDQVPNVRILAVRYLIELFKVQPMIWDKSFIMSNFAPLFKAMSIDAQQDREVIYQGAQALQALETLKISL